MDGCRHCLWDRLKESYMRYRFRGFAGKCMVKLLGAAGVQLRIMYCYVKRIETAGNIVSGGYRELCYRDFEAQVPVLPERFTQEKMSRIRDGFSVEGNHAYGIYDGDVLAGYGWISTLWMVREGRRLKAEYGYLWDDFTHPAYRGRGIHGRLIRIREQELVEAGKTVAVSEVDFFNRASQVGFERAGYVLRSKVYSWSFSGRQVKTIVRRISSRLY